MRGEIGNAIDWNKLNDTFLVDFKGVMYWFQKESKQLYTFVFSTFCFFTKAWQDLTGSRRLVRALL